MFLAAGGVPQVSRAASITQAHTSTNPLEQSGSIVLLWLRHAQRTRYEHQADANLCQASSCSPALLSALQAAGNFLPFCSASGSWHPSATYPAEHQSLATERWASFQSAFIFWIIYFWLRWTSSNQVYLIKLNFKGKKRLSSISSVGSRPATPALPHLCAQNAVAEAGSHPPGHLCHPCPSRVTMITSRDGGSAGSLVAPPASSHFHKRGNVSLGSGGISCVYACARSVSCPICRHHWDQPGYFSSVPGI